MVSKTPVLENKNQQLNAGSNPFRTGRSLLHHPHFHRLRRQAEAIYHTQTGQGLGAPPGANLVSNRMSFVLQTFNTAGTTPLQTPFLCSRLSVLLRTQHGFSPPFQSLLNRSPPHGCFPGANRYSSLAVPKLDASYYNSNRRHSRDEVFAYAYPILRLVSVPRDSKAGDLPDFICHQITHYLFNTSNGYYCFCTASSRDAVRRLSYP